MSIEQKNEVFFPDEDSVWPLIDNLGGLEGMAKDIRDAITLLPELNKIKDRDFVAYNQILGTLEATKICKSYLLKFRLDIENTIFFLDTYTRNANKIKKEIENEYR